MLTSATKHPTMMRRYYMVSGILLILSTVDFAVAAPALVREKSQTGVDVIQIPEGMTTMLGKRVDELPVSELWLKYLSGEDDVAKPEESSASSSLSPSVPADGFPNINQPPLLEKPLPGPVSSPVHAAPSPAPLTESGYDPMDVDPPPGPAMGRASSTIYSADHQLMAAHARPIPEPSAVFDEEMLDVLPPPSGPALPTAFNHEMVDVRPSRRPSRPVLSPNSIAQPMVVDPKPVSSPNPGSWPMAVDPKPVSSINPGRRPMVIDPKPVSSTNPNPQSMAVPVGSSSGKKKKGKQT